MSDFFREDQVPEQIQSSSTEKPRQIFPVKNNEQQSQFEIETDGPESPFLSYSRQGNVIDLMHTIVPMEMEGQGVGSALAKAALEYANENDLKIIPSCWFVREYLKRHPQYQHLFYRPE